MQYGVGRMDTLKLQIHFMRGKVDVSKLGLDPERMKQIIKE
jgi:hypothetical protein